MTSGSEVPYSSDSIQAVLQDLIHQRTGHIFNENSSDRLFDKLSPLAADRGFTSFLDYYYYLKYGEDVEAEWRRLESALAVNETYFWREYSGIEAAAYRLVPQFQLGNPGRPVRIWHAACSSGEEPYTMVISLMEAGAFNRGPVEIIATDFDEDALEHARQGVYGGRAFRAIPADIRLRYFVPQRDGRQRLIDLVRSRVQFSYLNLMHEAGMAAMQGFDLIFCRNAFIYFSPPAIRAVAERFYASLRSPGYLFIAAAESLLKITTLFSLNEVGGALVYKKED